MSRGASTVDPLREAATRRPDANAVIVPLGSADSRLRPGPAPPATRWSYRALDARVDRVAAGLGVRGIGPGDRVTIRLPPSLDAVTLLHACRRIGAVLVPLNPAWTDAEARDALEAAGGAAVVLGSEADVEAIEAGGVGAGPSRGAVGLAAAGERGATGLVGGAGAEEPAVAPASEDTPAAVLATSGTSGRPAAVSVTHRNLAESAGAVAARLGLGPDDRWLAVLSPAHVGGFALLDRAARVGCAVLPLTPFDAREVADLIEAGEVTHASLVPVMLARLLDERGERPPPPTLACLLVGGAAMPAPLLERALSLGYPVALTYGLTEATSQVATATPAEVRADPTSVGRALPGVELRIDAGESRSASADGPNPPAGAAERVGEILVRGPTVARLDSPSEVAVHARSTAVAGGEGLGRPSPLPSSRPFVDGDGWLHTGDLGSLDREGKLRVRGRLSERIVTGGTTVDPGQVEAALIGHSSVREVAAFGVPDAEWGERVVVAVVPSDPTSPPTLEALVAFARDRLSAPRRPRELRIVTELPRNASGKVERARLSAYVRELSDPQSREPRIP